MFAVVLVGGFGTRLRPLTVEVPKPMLPIVGRPMVERLVAKLAGAGVTDVVLALGFQPEPFQAAFPNDRVGDTRLHYAVEPEPLDTAGAIAFAARSAGVESAFLAVNGDIVSDLDVAAFVAAHRAFGGAATLHLTPVDDPSAFGVVELDDATGRIRRFVEKPQPGETDSNLINAGAYLLEPSVLDLVGENEAVSIERVVFPALVERGDLFGYPTDGYWIDTGKPDEFRAANLDLIDGRSGPAEPGVDPTARIDPDAEIEHSVIGAGAEIAAGARIVDSVIFPSATIAGNVTVNASIVDGHIAPDATLDRVVVGNGASVGAGEHLSDTRVPDPSTGVAS